MRRGGGCCCWAGAAGCWRCGRVPGASASVKSEPVAWWRCLLFTRSGFLFFWVFFFTICMFGGDRPRTGAAHLQLPSLPMWAGETTHACVQRTAQVCIGHPVTNLAKISSNGSPARIKGVHVVSMFFFGMVDTEESANARSGVTFIPLSEVRAYFQPHLDLGRAPYAYALYGVK